jgi:hypothetical protein
MKFKHCIIGNIGFYCLNRGLHGLHGLNFASDIYLPCHNFRDEGLTVFFEEFDAPLFIGSEFVDLCSFVVKEVGDLDLFY